MNAHRGHSVFRGRSGRAWITLIAVLFTSGTTVPAADLLSDLWPEGPPSQDARPCSWLDTCQPQDAVRFASESCAPPRRGTLLQWSYGTSFSGGPNLDEPLVTDRPDFTEASSTVGRRVLQIEMGYTFLSDTDGTTTTTLHSQPEALFRYGVLADWLEFTNDVQWDIRGGVGLNDAADDYFVGTGLSIRIW